MTVLGVATDLTLDDIIGTLGVLNEDPALLL